MKNTSKILTAVVAGAAIGAILGVLFAPEKGSEIRRKLNDEGKKLADDVKDKIRKGKEKFKHLKGDMEHKMEEDMAMFD
ncbi:MAG: YtxH domain-containing protein [Ferruginibacter sp.]